MLCVVAPFCCFRALAHTTVIGSSWWWNIPWGVASNPPWTLHKKKGNAKYPTTRDYPTTQPSILDLRASFGKGQHALLIEQPIQARITLSSLTDKTLQGLVFRTGRMGKDEIGKNPMACERNGEEFSRVAAFFIDLWHWWHAQMMQVARRCATLQITSNVEYHLAISTGLFQSTVTSCSTRFHTAPANCSSTPNRSNLFLFLRALRQDHWAGRLSAGIASLRSRRNQPKPLVTMQMCFSGQPLSYPGEKMLWSAFQACSKKLWDDVPELIWQEQCLIWRTCIPISSQTSTLCRETSHGALTHDAVSGCICRADTRNEAELETEDSIIRIFL